MSGFEIAGIVLGGLPLIVSALDAYAKGAGTIKQWRFYKRELKILKRGLETEQVKLQNICEKLLIGIADPAIIERLIEQPFGPLWKDTEISEGVRQRLWRSTKIFEDNVRDMSEAMEELKQKLNIGTDGLIQPQDPKGLSLRRELKRLTFALNKSVYLDLLTRIRDGISSLETLTTQDSDLEPERKKRTNPRLYRLMHSLSGNIYQALRTGISTCQCATSHNVGLRLAPLPSASIIPGDDDEFIIKKLSIELAVSHRITSVSLSGEPAQAWTALMMKPSTDQDQKQGQAHESPCSPTIECHNATKRPRRGVVFSLPEKAPAYAEVEITASGYTTKTSSTLTVRTSSSSKVDTSDETTLLDLCQTLRQLQTLPAKVCCGHITGPATVEHSKLGRYAVYPLGRLRVSTNIDNFTMIPLREALAQHLANASVFFHEDKLRLAYILASSVLQLTGTFWLPAKVTIDDIFVIKSNRETHYQEAFVIKQLPETSDQASHGINSPPNLPGAYHNQTWLSLGIILIEIMLGQSLDAFRVPRPEQDTSNPMGSFLSDYETAIAVLQKVNMIGGSNYTNAVERCIKCRFPHPKPDLNDDEFRRAVYAGIVARLEEDLKNVSSKLMGY